MSQNQLSLVEIHDRELKMLAYLNAICQENDLEYFLCGGTLIGAVRHKGFIPWDDDVDIYMKREAYNKLLKILEQDGEYDLFSLYSHHDYYYSYAKLVDPHTQVIESNKYDIADYGLFIDIFPLDCLPEGSLKAKLFLIHESISRKLLMTAIQKYSLHKNPVKRVVVKLTHMIGARRFAEQLDKLAQRYNGRSNASAYADASGALFTQYKLESSWFAGKTQLPFEEHMLSVPTKYDEYLKYSYGNYLQMPAVDQREDHHLDVKIR
ncbi:LicD family protein [Furfurilactobacillus siliginis]|uniref:LPS cholinephosphotransferase n=1 Tax=Furfurilactobacillus siliginis TaxID=348151 RepID=A0A0R2L5X1_9LACO|nr:LicD family protein [Furfurilactobacillus siliginis]KRN95317.1 LicD family protein [Furfurilactobacillus siliginis]GEK28285.1 LPS cholinephosphotransferase [Furfurilactobacillus siliginis]